MRVISISTLREFWEGHSEAEQPLKAWLDEARQATWNSPADIKEMYRSASVLKNRRVVFNIKGNDYRLIVAIAYRLSAVYVKFIESTSSTMQLMQTSWKWSDMNIKPIHTQQDYEAALKLVSPLFDNEPEPGTPEGDFLDVMVTLIEVYEARHFPIAAPTPIEAIKFRMEQSGLTAKDLEPAIGRVNRVYEILNGKRPLTLPMIRNLHRMFGIPVESLIGS